MNEGYTPATPAHPATMIGRLPGRRDELAQQVADAIATSLTEQRVDARGFPDIPENGHRWTITVTCQGASSITGDPTSYRDLSHVDTLLPQVIRAASLAEALRRASNVPLYKWFPEEGR